MTIVTDRYPSLSIANYAATLRKLHSEIEPITSVQDPRIEALLSVDGNVIDRSGFAGILDEGPQSQMDLATIYFQRFVVPSIPLPVTPPSWSAHTQVLAGDWPNIDIEFRSFLIEMGKISAHWHHCIGITIDDDEAPDGSVPIIPAGTVHDDEKPALIVSTPEGMFEIDLHVDDMDDLGHVLRVAAGGMNLHTTRSTN
ncbi:hypothetical protein [Microbacterium sp. NPDC064584]|uniref:hypothetical protein n=1 Tax=Microbacterium sp. NPDC064584 TaxID=3155817 RepID=UPI00341E3FA8